MDLIKTDDHNERKNYDEYIIINCDECGKEVKIKKYRLTDKLKRSKSKRVFCSPVCSKAVMHRESLVEVECSVCKKIFYRTRGDIRYNEKRGCKAILCSNECRQSYIKQCNTKYKERTKKIVCNNCGIEKEIDILEYNKKLKRNKTGVFYCSNECSSTMSKSQETIEKIRQAQVGIPVKERGRNGHKVSVETRKKISEAYHKVERTKPMLELIHNCMKFLDINKYSTTIGIVPDAVYIENNKLIAVESERSLWKSSIKYKIHGYDTVPNSYDEVHIFWLDAKNDDKISTHYHKKGGKWNEIPIENLNITV